MPSFVDPIVAIRLTANGYSGITLYAPPWEDADGEEWQGFLGDGSKIVLFGTAAELREWLSANPDHDLADHPAWPAFDKRGVRVLEPAEDAEYDFDSVYELAAEQPDPTDESRLGDIVDIATRIAESCEDGALRSLLGNTREYALLVEGETDYHGKEGAAEWAALGEVIASTWERALNRIQVWLRWEGSSAQPAEHDEE